MYTSPLEVFKKLKIIYMVYEGYYKYKFVQPYRNQNLK